MEKYISIQNLIDAEDEAVQKYNELVNKISCELEALDCLADAEKDGMIRSGTYVHNYYMRINRIKDCFNKSKELQKEIVELRKALFSQLYI